MSPIADGIREFVNRDWQLVRAAKDAYWRGRIAALGPQEAWRVAEEVRQQALRQTPGWPREADREADLQAHVRLSILLGRVDSARRA